MSDDSSDEWGTEELEIPVLPPGSLGATQPSETRHKQSDEDEWPEACLPQKETKVSKDSGGEPMILVDLTKLSDGEIHCRFDPNSVNDTDAASSLKRDIEKSYSDYSKNTSFISEGVVIPCGSSVWRPAMMKVRKERPGHYIAPVFRRKNGGLG